MISDVLFLCSFLIRYHFGINDSAVWFSASFGFPLTWALGVPLGSLCPACLCLGGGAGQSGCGKHRGLGSLGVGDWVPLLCLGHLGLRTQSLCCGYVAIEKGVKFARSSPHTHLLLPGFLCCWHCSDVARRLGICLHCGYQALPWCEHCHSWGRARFLGAEAVPASLPSAGQGCVAGPIPCLLCRCHFGWGCGFSWGVLAVRVSGCVFTVLPSLHGPARPPSGVPLCVSFRHPLAELGNLCRVTNAPLVVDRRGGGYKGVLSPCPK